jgi:hypothetical protein
MAGELFALLHQQPIPPGLQAAISHLQSAAASFKGKHIGHGMGVAIEIAEVPPEQQHAATFGIDRALMAKLAERVEAFDGLADLGGVLFREPPWED